MSGRSSQHYKEDSGTSSVKEPASETWRISLNRLCEGRLLACIPAFLKKAGVTSLPVLRLEGNPHKSPHRQVALELRPRQLASAAAVLQSQTYTRDGGKRL